MFTIKETMKKYNLPDKQIRLKYGLTKITTEVLMDYFNTENIDSIMENLYPYIDINTMNNKTIKNASEFLKDTIFNTEKKILLITDYDCDGISSAVIGERLFRKVMNSNRYRVLVNKRKYGNGISHDLLNEVNISEYDIIITADHGSSNNSIFKELKEKNSNLKIILTDHHTFREDNKPTHADYFINNQLFFQEDKKEWEIFKDASGCLMLFCLLYQTLKDSLSKDIIALEAYPFLAITAISDVMPMNSAINRSLIHSGIRVMNDKRSILFNTIKSYCIQEPLYTPEVIKFNLSPLINTGNRQHCEEMTFRLLSSDTPSEITDLLSELLTKNNERKKMTNALTTAILKSDKLKGEYGQTITIKTTMGINGIISSKIGEIKQKPTICFLEENGEYHGSARSILEEIDIIEILDRLNKDGLIKKYGGHREAAGCSVESFNIDEFRYKFDLYVKEKLESCNIDRNTISVFRKLDPREVNVNNIINLSHLEPTGKDFKDPVFYTELTINSCFSSESMTFLTFEEISPIIKGVAFHNGKYDYKNTFLKGNKIGIVFTMKLSYFKNVYQCNLNIQNATLIGV